MDIDTYQQCPCHSGKKIKFCCGKDIVAELNQIVAKCNSNQSLSALDQIERVIAKHGEKDCLLNLQTHILFTLGEVEKAEISNRQFVDKNPNHPMGRQHEAMSALAKGDVVLAIEKLQDALDLIKEDEIPLPLANTFKMIGGVLLSAGHIIAARAHLQYALMVRGEATDEIKSMLAESYRIPGAPLILKTDFRLDRVPVDKEWSDKYELIVQRMNRGQFRLALKMLERMDEHWPDQIEIVRGIAVVHSMLAHEQHMSAAWRRVAKLDLIPEWQAVEAEALGQIFLEKDPSGELDIVFTECQLNDLDSVIETVDTNSRFVSANAPEQDPFEDGPPPRFAFYILDRHQIEPAEDLAPHDIPLVIGEMLLYGKQTDRDARLVFVGTKNEYFDAAIQFLVDTFEKQITGELNEQVISTTSVAADTLAWNWQIPKGLKVDQHRELIAKHRKHILMEKWPNIRFTCLNDATPLEAKDNAELSIPLAGLILNLEQSTILQLAGDEDINELKNLCGIAIHGSLNAAEFDEELWTPLRVSHFDPKTFSDDQIVRVYADAITIGNTKILKRIIPEILNRDSLDQIPKDICYSMLAQLTDEDEKAVEYLQQARLEAKNSGRSIGQLLVQEFEVRLTRGLTDKLPELLQMIQQKHMGEPNVEYQLVRVLSKYGLISADGRTVSLPSAPASEASDSESKIWTPDSDEPAMSSGSAGGASKIWVPGSE